MKETQKTIINALVFTVIATLFFFALTFILFDFFKAGTSLKDAWATLGSFFGGITTLVAAYVATKLFNDWRDQEKIIFLRNVAYETSNLILTLFNIMQGYSGEKESLLNQVMPIQSQITLKLAILNKQIKDGQMHLVNTNFKGFIKDYIGAIELYQHDKQALNNQVRILINSYGAELGYITGLANLDNIFEKLAAQKL